MAVAAYKYEKLYRIAAWRIVAILVLLSFSFQSYVAQTHIHEVAATGFTQSVHQLGHSKLPPENSPIDCHFCQAMTYAGSFFLPDAWRLLFAPQWVKIAIFPFLHFDNDTAMNRNWRSRAPPSH